MYFYCSSDLRANFDVWELKCNGRKRRPKSGASRKQLLVSRIQLNSNIMGTGKRWSPARPQELLIKGFALHDDLTRREAEGRRHTPTPAKGNRHKTHFREGQSKSKRRFCFAFFLRLTWRIGVVPRKKAGGKEDLS